MNDIILPSDEPEKSEDGRPRGDNFLAIGHVHLYANDIAELRRLAEVNPDLAEKVIEQRDRENARIVGSYKLGLISSIVLLGLVLTAFTLMVIFRGIFETIVGIGFILATALLVRVVLTGEWSETSWVGKIVNALIKALGGQTGSD